MRLFLPATPSRRSEGCVYDRVMETESIAELYELATLLSSSPDFVVRRILQRIERGELSVEQAINLLSRSE
jgi:hypothetical protein